MTARLHLGCAAAWLATAVVGCAHTGYRSVHEQGLDAPDSYGNGTSRPGGWSKSLGFRWADRGRYAVSRDNSMRATWAIEDCWHVIRLESDEGSWESRGYGHVGQLRASPDGGRFAFVGKRAGRSVAVVDGVEQVSLDLIANCDIELSKDGKHFAFSTWANNDKRTPAGVVVDGQHNHVRPADPNTAIEGDQLGCTIDHGANESASDRRQRQARHRMYPPERTPYRGCTSALLWLAAPRSNEGGPLATGCAPAPCTWRGGRRLRGATCHPSSSATRRKGRPTSR